MEYNDLKNEVDSVISRKTIVSDSQILTASDLIMLMNDSLLDVYDMLDDDMFIYSINKSNGYSSKPFRRIKTYKNHLVPFVSDIKYSTLKEKCGNMISITFVDNYNSYKCDYILNIFKSEELESFEYNIVYEGDDFFEKVDVDFLKNYINQFVAENYNELCEKFKIMEGFSGVIRESKIEFNESIQEICTDGFKIKFDSSNITNGVYAVISFEDEEKEELSNTMWLSRPSIKSYINDRKNILLDHLLVNIDDLNSFYRFNVNKSLKEELVLKNIK